MLNDQQLSIVRDAKGNTIVFAGAGSGKTHTLVELIKKLIYNDGVNPHSIFVTTFTNAAGKQLKARIVKNLKISPETVEKMWIGTFHSLAYRYLKFILKSKFTMLTDSANNQFLKLAYENVQSKQPKLFKGLNTEGLDKIVVQDVRKKKTMCSPWKNYIKRNPDQKEHYELCKKVEVEFNRLKKKDNVKNFDDLLHSFRTELTEDFKKRFTWMIIDESQDMNKSQFRLIDAFEASNILYLGDIKQSLYEFRGARPQLFAKKMKDHNLFNLQYNYRSSKTIIDLANEFVSLSVDYKDQQLIATKPAKKLPEYILSYEPSEAIFQKVLDLKRSGVKPKDIAILSFSVKGQMIASLTSLLRQNKIPYEIRGGSDPYEAEHIQDFINLFYAVYTPNKANLLQAFTMFKGVGHKKAAVNIDSFLMAGILDSSLSDFQTLLKVRGNKSALVDGIWKVTMNCHPKLMKDDSNNTILDELATKLSNCDNILTELDQLRTDDDKSNVSERLVISTIHRFKGLEAGHVIACGIDSKCLRYYKMPFLGDNPFKDDKFFTDFCLYYTVLTRAIDSLTLVGQFSQNTTVSVAPFMALIDQKFFKLISEDDGKIDTFTNEADWVRYRDLVSKGIRPEITTKAEDLAGAKTLQEKSNLTRNGNYVINDW